MRTFTIITNGETITDVEAERMAIDGGIISFWDGEELVGLVRDWSVITSDPGREITLETALDMIDAVSGVSDLSRGELPELADPSDAFPDDAVVNPHLAEMQEAQAHVDAQRQQHIADVIDVPETSEPDAPGVSTDPDPEPETAPSEDDVDANPPEPSPSESTDADHPSAEGEAPVVDQAEMDVLGLRINETFGEYRRKPIIDKFLVWVGEEDIPAQVRRMTIEDRRRVLAWFEANR